MALDSPSSLYSQRKLGIIKMAILLNTTNVQCAVNPFFNKAACDNLQKLRRTIRYKRTGAA